VENIRKHNIVFSFWYCLLAITSILKILKSLGQEAILSTEDEIPVEFLAFEWYLRFSYQCL